MWGLVSMDLEERLRKENEGIPPVFGNVKVLHEQVLGFSRYLPREVSVRSVNELTEAVDEMLSAEIEIKNYLTKSESVLSQVHTKEFLPVLREVKGEIIKAVDEYSALRNRLSSEALAIFDNSMQAASKAVEHDYEVTKSRVIDVDCAEAVFAKLGREDSSIKEYSLSRESRASLSKELDTFLAHYKTGAWNLKEIRKNQRFRKRIFGHSRFVADALSSKAYYEAALGVQLEKELIAITEEAVAIAKDLDKLTPVDHKKVALPLFLNERVAKYEHHMHVQSLESQCYYITSDFSRKPVPEVLSKYQQERTRLLLAAKDYELFTGKELPKLALLEKSMHDHFENSKSLQERMDIIVAETDKIPLQEDLSSYSLINIDGLPWNIREAATKRNEALLERRKQLDAKKNVAVDESNALKEVARYHEKVNLLEIIASEKTKGVEKLAEEIKSLKAAVEKTADNPQYASIGFIPAYTQDTPNKHFSIVSYLDNSPIPANHKLMKVKDILQGCTGIQGRYERAASVCDFMMVQDKVPEAEDRIFLDYVARGIEFDIASNKMHYPLSSRNRMETVNYAIGMLRAASKPAT
jgi:hypothetical protein